MPTNRASGAVAAGKEDGREPGPERDTGEEQERSSHRHAPAAGRGDGGRGRRVVLVGGPDVRDRRRAHERGAAGRCGDQQRGPSDLLELVRRRRPRPTRRSRTAWVTSTRPMARRTPGWPCTSGAAPSASRLVPAAMIRAISVSTAASARRRPARDPPRRRGCRRRWTATPGPRRGRARRPRPRWRAGPRPASRAASTGAARPAPAQRIRAAASSAAMIRTPRIAAEGRGSARSDDATRATARPIGRRGGLAGRHRDDGAGPDREDDRDQGEAHGLAVAVAGDASVESGRSLGRMPNVSNGQYRSQARPMTWRISIGPKLRESAESWRWSPMTRSSSDRDEPLGRAAADRVGRLGHAVLFEDVRLVEQRCC